MSGADVHGHAGLGLDDDDDAFPSPSPGPSHVPLLLLVPLLVFAQTRQAWLIGHLLRLTHRAGGFGNGSKEKALLDEIQTLKAKQSGLHIRQEFATYAKIDRQLIKLRDELKPFQQARQEQIGQARKAYSYTFYMIWGLAFLFVMWNYAREPVVRLDPDWLFFPLGWLVSLPTGVSGAIGLPFWMFTCRTVSQAIAQRGAT